jgi:hypothetical protein
MNQIALCLNSRKRLAVGWLQRNIFIVYPDRADGRSLARMRGWGGAVSASGWPDRGSRNPSVALADELPPAEAGAEAYRARALTSTVLHAALSDLPPKAG